MFNILNEVTREPLEDPVSRALREGNAWIVELKPQPGRPETGIPVERDSSALPGPRLFLPADEVGKEIEKLPRRGQLTEAAE